MVMLKILSKWSQPTPNTSTIPNWNINQGVKITHTLYCVLIFMTFYNKLLSPTIAWTQENYMKPTKQNDTRDFHKISHTSVFLQITAWFLYLSPSAIINYAN